MRSRTSDAKTSDVKLINLFLDMLAAEQAGHASASGGELTIEFIGDSLI